MGKIKLSLVSGAVLEKPLINVFKANNNTYVVLDNEMNGSMGLPIILVSKMVDNKLTKIIDQNEWQVVKECLKNIIAGGQVEYVAMPNEISADDIYYTQLTLPVPSFDALKNSYNTDSDDNENGAANEIGIMDFNPNPVESNGQSVVTSQASETSAMPNLNNITSAEPQVSNPAPSSEPIINFGTPLQAVETHSVNASVNPEPVVNQVPDLNASLNSVVEPTSTEQVITPKVEEPVMTPPVTPEITVTPAASEVTPVSPISTVNSEPVFASPVTPIPEVNNGEDKFKEEKEKFLKACEELFDSIIKKIEDSKN